MKLKISAKIFLLFLLCQQLMTSSIAVATVVPVQNSQSVSSHSCHEASSQIEKNLELLPKNNTHHNQNIQAHISVTTAGLAEHSTSDDDNENCCELDCECSVTCQLSFLMVWQNNVQNIKHAQPSFFYSFLSIQSITNSLFRPPITA